ncbi:MAG: hypothetical protein M1376_18675 [Planctomycetes bacterium]|nr:hypothetical protein [Planctomycetota bacterium]
MRLRGRTPCFGLMCVGMLFVSAPYASMVPEIKVESKDRLYQAVIRFPEGTMRAGFFLKNRTASQDLGGYFDLLSSPPGAIVYKSEEEAVQFDDSREESEQPVVIIQDRGDRLKFTVTTVFDDLGEVELKVTYDGESLLNLHALAGDKDTSELIETLDDLISTDPRPVEQAPDR